MNTIFESPVTTFCDLANRKQRSNYWYENTFGKMYICTSNYYIEEQIVWAICISSIEIKRQRQGDFIKLINMIREQYDGVIRVENAFFEFGEALQRHGFICDKYHSEPGLYSTVYLPAGKNWE